MIHFILNHNKKEPFFPIFYSLSIQIKLKWGSQKLLGSLYSKQEEGYYIQLMELSLLRQD
jgi:hypothetical protein